MLLIAAGRGGLCVVVPPKLRYRHQFDVGLEAILMLSLPVSKDGMQKRYAPNFDPFFLKTISIFRISTIIFFSQRKKEKVSMLLEHSLCLYSKKKKKKK